MKIAIMQPYFFPYEGYFDLIRKVDLFVFLDDVQYIRRGWVNRNKINAAHPLYLTVPVQKASRDTLIKDMKISGEWVTKHLETFKHVFGQKVVSNKVFQYYQSLAEQDDLCPMLCNSVKWMSKHLGISGKFDYSHNYPSIQKGKERILELCKILKADQYFNLPGGIKLYDPVEFQQRDIDLKFLDTSHFDHWSILQKCLR